eukprot:TRINITY_DN1986_c0_g1_i1.p1 TRINITY_DN1986_c0_g1~~TRINITY_DN1986_c0_g1_i1.p1  ORF type:complete len:389 (+),score=96.80 TRINITY_DN1986_c0_g1_i1:203-1369(+)
MAAGENQYVRVAAHLKLANAISELYSPLFKREINPLTEVVVTNGATQSIFNAMFSLLEEGDEVIVFEPFFEFYIAPALFAGARVRYFSMTPPTDSNGTWTVDFDALEQLFSSRTKMIVLNTPHNPTGKVFTKQEYERIAKIIAKHPRAIVLADEVYEFMSYDKRQLVRFATIDGMWDRTISVYSAGKTFSATGWRIGWSVGPAPFIKGLVAAQNWSTFNVHRPTQVGVADVLVPSRDQPYEGHASYYQYLNALFEGKRNTMMEILSKAPLNWKLLNPEGGYFILANIKDIVPTIPRGFFYREDHPSFGDQTPIGCDYRELKDPQYTPDFAMVRYMTNKFSVTPIPMTTFYDNSAAKSVKENKCVDFIRLAICKSDATVEGVRQRLNKN